MLTWSRVEKLLKMCKTPASGAQTPVKTEIAAFFAIELSIRAAIVAAYKRLGTPVNREKQYVSRQSSSAGRRKGTAQDPGGIQASDRRALRHGVLHHQPRRKSCRDLSSGRVAPNRGEAGQAVQLQSFEKEISEQSELLRPDGGNGCAGAGADAADSARIRRNQGRRGRVRKFDVPGSSQHGSLEATG